MPDPESPENTRWPEVEGLFDEVLELPPEARAAWLDREVRDPELRARVDALLTAHERADADRFLAEPAVVGTTAAPGSLIGPYRIVEEVGRGGMGVVYRAARADGQFDQEVALKIIKRGFDTDQVVQRFLRERQILARLVHPNIASLLDGGVTESGQPWFAMELVRGVPITTFCDERGLDVDQRLRLFMQAGEAVQYAHRNLVIHRDLKPSNILVTEDGTVKLLDFGIARLVTDDESDTGLTRTAMRVWTPAYASPEQAAGGPVTTLTDVYSLGVVLYELLSGRSPVRRTPGTDTGTAMRTADIRKPSTALGAPTEGEDDAPASPEEIARARSTTLDRLRRRLAGDLDLICLEALRPEPERRYESAAALVDDVSRHLGRFPVRARPDTAAYRVKRFVQRHRAGVSAAALSVAALAIGLAGALWQARVAAEERDVAEQVTEFTIGLFENADPAATQGETVTVRELLDRGAERLEGELADQPLVQARMLRIVGQVYLQLGLPADAEPLLTQALARQRELLGPGDPEVATSAALLATALRRNGRHAEAVPLLEEVLAIRQAQRDPDHPEVQDALWALGEVSHEGGDPERGDSLLQVWRDIDRRAPGEPTLQRSVRLLNLAQMLDVTGREAEAESAFREALAVQRALPDPDPFAISLTLSRLGSHLQSNGRLAEAEEAILESLAIQRRLYPEGHSETGITLLELGRVRRRQGRLDEAITAHREALALFDEHLGARHPYGVVVRTSLGELGLEAGTPEEALGWFEAAADVAGELFGQESPMTLQARRGAEQAREALGRTR